MKQLLIIFHSITGGSEQIAQAVAQGARKEPEIEVILRQAQHVQPEHLREASGYIFIAPETLGSLSGMMKDFFDRTFYQVLDELNGRWCVTPEFPQGTYAYFTAIDDSGRPVYPYNMGRRYYGRPRGRVIASIQEPVTTHFQAAPSPPSPAAAPKKTSLIWNPDSGGYRTP